MPPTQMLSKSKLLAWRQCPKRLWLELYSPELRADSATTKVGFMQGNLVGAIARQLYDPQGRGVVFDPLNDGYDEVIVRTTGLLALGRPIFKAGFSAHGLRFFADVMVPSYKNGKRVWRLVEIKSSSQIESYHYDDAAIQWFVVQVTRSRVTSISIAHVDSAWIYPGDNYNGLLKEVDVTDEVAHRIDEVKNWISAAQAVSRKTKKPSGCTGTHCFVPYRCGFINHCQHEETAAAFPAVWLPNVRSEDLREHLGSVNSADMRDVPDTLLPPLQRLIKTSTLSRNACFDSNGAAADLASYKSPAYFLGLKTINLAVPRWKGTRPYMQIPFQFSLHRLSRSGKLVHQAFIDLSGKDPSRLLAQALIKSCGKRGPIFVYGRDFETSRIRELAERFPKLRYPLMAITGRIVDLQEIATKRDGSMAMDAYLEATRPGTTGSRRKEIERKLLDYCEFDTTSLMQLWKLFKGYSTI